MQFWASFGTSFLYYSIRTYQRIRESGGLSPSLKSGGSIPCPPAPTPMTATQSGLVSLTFDLLTLKPVMNVSRGTDDLPSNFGVSARLFDGQSCIRLTLTFDLWRHHARRWCGSSYSTPFPSSNFVGLPLRKLYGAFSVSTIIGLVTWPLNGVTGHPCRDTADPSRQFLASCALPFSTYSQARDRQTDRQTTAINA